MRPSATEQSAILKSAVHTPLSNALPASHRHEVLGHTQLRTTERYTHATRAMVHDAAERMEKILGGSQNGAA